MSVHNNPDSITQKMYTALTKVNDTKNSVKVSVGSFRGAHVKLVLNGETYKMSFKELQEKVKNLNTSELNENQLEILNSKMKALGENAAVTPKGKALLGKVKDAFKSFKDKLGDAKDKLGEVKGKIEAAPGKIRDAKHESDVNRHVHHFAVNTALVRYTEDGRPTKESLENLAKQLLKPQNLNLTDLKKLQVILKHYNMPELLKETNQRIALMHLDVDSNASASEKFQSYANAILSDLDTPALIILNKRLGELNAGDKASLRKDIDTLKTLVNKEINGRDDATAFPRRADLEGTAPTAAPLPPAAAPANVTRFEQVQDNVENSLRNAKTLLEELTKKQQVLDSRHEKAVKAAQNKDPVLTDTDRGNLEMRANLANARLTRINNQIETLRSHISLLEVDDGALKLENPTVDSAQKAQKHSAKCNEFMEAVIRLNHPPSANE